MSRATKGPSAAFEGGHPTAATIEHAYDDVAARNRRWWPSTGSPERSVHVTVAGSERKRRVVRFLQRYLLNPPAMLAVRTGLVPGYVVIETIGRRTGKRRRTVVGMQVEGSTGWVVAEHGSHTGYVRNLTANPTVRVCIRGKWRTAHAEVVPEDDAEARLAGFGRSIHASTVRRFGTELVTVRFRFAPA